MQQVILAQTSSTDNAEKEREHAARRVVDRLRRGRHVALVVLDGDAFHVHQGHTPQALVNALGHYNGRVHAFAEGLYAGELDTGLAAFILAGTR